LRLHLVEASPLLRAEQKRRLADAAPVWLDDAGELPAGPMLLVANEFLDALPIRQFVRGAAGWAERMVALDRAGALVFADMPADPAGALMAAQAGRDAGPGDVVEICPAALSLAAMIGSRVAREPGAALFIDYARANRRSGSLRAVRAHRPAPVLSEPGSADLSAEVDFAAFSEVARAAGAAVWGPAPQARFLAGLGAQLRLARLAEHASPAQRRSLEEGLERLLDPAGMGGFQVLAIVSPALVEPP
jgi:NADH dehydrogenase [ubiquinone] 1 alpha subcomplex assembly factor 7